MRGKNAPPPQDLEATGRNGDETSDEARERQGNTDEGAQSQQRQTQQENPGEETATRPTPAAAPAEQSSARDTATTMTGISPQQEVVATGRSTAGTSVVGNQDEDTQAQQSSTLSTMMSDASVGETRTIPTDPGSRRQGYRLSTEKHPDNPYLFYADGRGRRK